MHRFTQCNFYFLFLFYLISVCVYCVHVMVLLYSLAIFYQCQSFNISEVFSADLFHSYSVSVCSFNMGKMVREMELLSLLRWH